MLNLARKELTVEDALAEALLAAESGELGDTARLQQRRPARASLSFACRAPRLYPLRDHEGFFQAGACPGDDAAPTSAPSRRGGSAGVQIGWISAACRGAALAPRLRLEPQGAHRRRGIARRPDPCAPTTRGSSSSITWEHAPRSRARSLLEAALLLPAAAARRLTARDARHAVCTLYGRMLAGVEPSCLPCLLLKPAGVAARAEKAEGRPWIHKLDIEGVKSVKARATWKSKIPPSRRRAGSPLSPKHYLDPFAIDVDKKRIEAYYAAHGYFFARVTTAEVKPTKGGKAVDIRLVVDEGPATKINDLVVDGLDPIGPEAQKLHRRLKLQLPKGMVFDEDKYPRAEGRARDAAAQDRLRLGRRQRRGRRQPRLEVGRRELQDRHRTEGARRAHLHP